MSTDPNSNTGKTITVVGFGRRLVAALIDGLLVLFFTTILAFTVGILLTTVAMFRPNAPLPFNSLMIGVGVIFSLVYYVGFWTKSGQTIGKGLMSIQVVGADGEPISWGKGLLRYIGYIISGVVASIGFLWLAFDPQRQGWHDKIAGTYVIGENDAFTNVNEVELVPSDPGRSWIWLVIWVIVAVAVPGGLFSSLWFLGPTVNRIVGEMIGGLLG